MAKPVVVTDVGGNSELVLDNQTGLLVPPRDPAALAQGMLRLIGAPTEAATLGWAGRRLVEAHFSHEVKAARVEELYLDILQRKGCHRA
jgi:glycosyltransferase involved in cell wall biosynthesis